MASLVACIAHANEFANAADNPADAEAPGDAAVVPTTRRGAITQRHVPYILAVHDFISAIASGMTVKCGPHMPCRVILTLMSSQRPAISSVFMPLAGLFLYGFGKACCCHRRQLACWRLECLQPWRSLRSAFNLSPSALVRCCLCMCWSWCFNESLCRAPVPRAALDGQFGLQDPRASTCATLNSVMTACDVQRSLTAGRVETMLSVKGFAIICQGIMASLPQLWPVTWVMAPLLLARWCDLAYCSL